MEFYTRTLDLFIQKGYINKSDTILVLAGGNFDRQCMMNAKLENVIISNLDYHHGQKDYLPYQWKRLDAEKIEEESNSFDWVVIHAGLHHCAIPALAVCEMFRVARKGILCIEARDSLMMKRMIKMGLTPEYELEPVFLSDGLVGGYRNGNIPNHIYRWTELEFEKTINTFAPHHKHTYIYNYGYKIPIKRFDMAKNSLYHIIGFIMSKLTWIAEVILPRQGNKFAFAALKNVEIQPWLTPDLTFKKDYLSQTYDKSKYKR